MWAEAAEIVRACDAIEVVDLSGVLGDAIRDRMTGKVEARRARASAEVAQAIGGLLVALPPAEQMRCHIPPFGLAFLKDDQAIGWASICWKCNNVQGRAGDGPLFYEFDASAQASRDLLRLCKATLADAGR